MSWLFLTRKSIVQGIVQGGQKCPCVHIWVNIQNRQLTVLQAVDPFSRPPRYLFIKIFNYKN